MCYVSVCVRVAVVCGVPVQIGLLWVCHKPYSVVLFWCASRIVAATLLIYQASGALTTPPHPSLCSVSPCH